MKNLFFPVLTLPFLLAGAAVDFGNNLVKMKVEPVGGRISSLKLNDGQELTAVDGLLGDNFTHHDRAKFFLTRQLYNLEKSGNTIRLSAHHTGGGIDFLKLGKIISLKPGETVVDVKYTFHNLPAAMAANEYAFASQNFVNSSIENIRMFFPVMTGISLVPAHGSGMNFSYFRQPSRSWIGYTGKNGGLAITMDYRFLSHFYGWFGKKETTQEFYFDKIRINANETITSNVELILFHTLQRISGAGGGLVGELSSKRNGRTDTQQQLKLRLYSARPQTVKLVFTSRKLRNGSPEKIHEKTLHFSKGGTIKDITFHHHFKQFPALFDIEARAYSHQGKLLAIFNMPLGLGTGEIAYRMIPQENLKKNQSPSIDLTKFDNSKETPHIKWAKPIKGGTIKMFGLTPYPSYRELAELTQRMDIDLHSSLFIAHGRAANTSGDYFGLLTETDISNNISEQLQKDYDCILLGGINLDKLTSSQRQEILRKVNNGCGLVLIGCSGKNKDIFNISPLIPQNKGDYPRKPPRKTIDHFITSLYPWYLLPVTTCIPQKLNGTKLAHTANAPFIATRDYGKGRVVAISFISNGGSGRMVGGLTPDLPYPQEDAEYREYIELYQLLFSKMIAFAAKRDIGCQIQKVQIKPMLEKFVVLAEFKNLPNTPEKYTLTIFSYNRDGEKLTQQDFPFTTSKNGKFVLPAKRWNGQQMIGFVLRDSNGNVTDFGAQSAMYLPLARSHKLTANKTHYQENETAIFTLKSAVETKAAQVRWKLCDAFARVVKSGQAPAQPQMTFNVKISSSLASRNYTFITEMYINGILSGRRSIKFTATPAPEKNRFDDFEVGIWITPYSYEASRAPFQKFYSDALRKMGVTTIMGNNRKTDIDFPLANNFNPTLYKSGGTRPAQISSEYRKTRNKMLLVRTPCLSSPLFRTKMQKEFQKFGKEHSYLGASFHWFGDELSLTGYWSSAIDFCYSPSCIKEFQKFLAKKYGTVQKAAAQWGKEYTSFEQFIPETYTESKARKDGNYSAWADHLEYMDQLLCDYVDLFAKKGLQKGDPLARSFISGPQGPSAYGGNNWAIQSQVYTGLMSYNIGGLQDILHSFNPQTVDLPWILGYANYDGDVCYKLWKNLQYRVRGSMGFAMASMVRPDGTLARSGQAAAKYLPEIQSGIGKLFINMLNFAQPEIAILYSQSSIRSAYISGRAKEHEELFLKYITLCRNFGIPFRIISEKEILSNVLNKSMIKLLILPDSNALNTDVLIVLNKFISNGGKILSEGSLAGMDSSCSTRKTPISLPGSIRIANIRTGYISAYKKAISSRDNNEINLLNFERKEFAKVLKISRITPIVTYFNAEGKEFYDAETAVLVDNQQNKYVLSVCKEKFATTVQTKFHQNGYVSTIRGDKSFMKNDNPLLFLFTTKKENGKVTLTAKSKTSKQLTITTTSGNGRDTVFHVSVKDPFAQEIKHYSANINAPKGNAKFSINFAENDPIGVWQITIKDVTTNSTATVQHALK